MTSPIVNLQSFLSQNGHRDFIQIQYVQTMINKVVCRPFIRKDAVNKIGECPIYLNVNVNGERGRILYEFSIKLKYWNPKLNRVHTNHPSAIDFNRNIETLIQRINKITSDANFDGVTLTKSLIEKKLVTQQITGDFISYMSAAITARHDIKETTKTTQRITVAKLAKFQPQIKAADLTNQLVKRFKNYLESQSFSINYIAGQLKNFKTYFERLQDETGIKLPAIFAGIKTPWHTKSIVYLTPFELKKLHEHYEEIKTTNKKYRNTYILSLRYYLFSCYTGLRISDINRLAQAQYSNNQITFIAKKQRMGREHSHTVPLNKKAQSLWLEIVASRFKSISDVHKNKMLKLIAKNNKIKKPLKYHTSRHTCATTLIQLGSPLPNVQDLLDHKNVKTTMIYTHVSKSNVAKSVALMDKL